MTQASNQAGTVPTVTLNDGVTIPQVGFGVWRIPDDDVEQAVSAALAAGYRSIDTASAYANERGVGSAVTATDIPREEIFVTTKLANPDHGYERALAAIRASLERLGLAYVDLFLIHWPLPWQDDYVDTWRALLQARADGLTRSVGVSNFTAEHIDRLVDETGVAPSVNQVELHPLLQQGSLRSAHRERGVATEAWSPLAQGKLFGDPTLAGIAARHDRSVAQVVLRWHLELGNIVIPKSVTPERIAENIDVLDFALDDADMSAISRLEDGTRLGPHPDRRR
jgi:2,5-diketo-D-gluconate reductase A